MLRRSVVVLFSSIFLIMSVAGYADDTAIAGRGILTKYQNAIITVKLILKQGVSIAGRDTNRSESKSETSGTVIDPSGLTVISLSATDPSSIIGDMMAGGDEDGMKYKFESEVSDIKLVLPDATEIAAKIVLRDKDLDLAFLRPETPLTKQLTSVDLSKDTKPQILDELILLNRLGKVGNRVPSVSLDRVKSIIEKPRTFYIPGLDSSSGGGLGSPAFTLDGKLVGIVLLRSIKSEGRPDIGSMLSSGSNSLGIIPVILPAADILEAAQQAPQTAKAAAAAEKKSTEPKAK